MQPKNSSNLLHIANLVWITPNSEKLIAHIARVSNPQGQNMDRPYKGLLKYLVKHKHWSPFEMSSMCVEITTTRAIAAQILRHRSFSFQEFSQRYSSTNDMVCALDGGKDGDIYGFPSKDIDEIYGFPSEKIPLTESLEPFMGFDLRSQDLTNKQNSVDDINRFKKEELLNEIIKAEKNCYKVYQHLLDNGVAKECARGILPLNTPTRLYMTGTIRSWMHYVSLRNSNGTQTEHMKISKSISDIIKDELPNVYPCIVFDQPT